MMVAEAAALFDGPVTVPWHDKRIDTLLNRYRERWGLGYAPVTDDGSLWLGLTFNNKLAVVVNVTMLNPVTMCVLNVCPVRGRNGVLATYEVLHHIRNRVDRGELRGVICNVLYDNKAFQRALARVFGQDYSPTDYLPKPRALVYAYGVV